MGCFFACLRGKDGSSRPHLVSSSKSAAKQGRSVSSNRLSSLFSNEDKGDYPSNNKAKGRSSIPNRSIDKFQVNKQHNQPPTPVKLFEALERSSDSPENLPNSCISNVANIGSDEITVDKTVKVDIESTSRYEGNKSVTFECECDASSSKNGDQSASKTSPNSTPLKLSGEMQAPGTVFPSTLEAKKEETFSSREMGEEKELSERQEEANSKLEVGVKQTTVVKELEEEGGLSSWLKPKGPKQHTIDDRIRKIPNSGKTLVDRPIIGMVAAHWNEDEPTRVSPKWWDGNGIPNSTNKYKEDQKVSWHATSFEERLEKALSDESLVSQGKHVNQTPMAFNETDESDTALSQLRPSPHSKSVVSF